MSPEATRGWIEFADHIEIQLGPGGELEPIRGFANKLAEHAARLAAVVALVDDITAPAVSGEHLAAGIELAEHYAGEALRMFAAGRADPNLTLAQKTLDWLKVKWTEDLISPVDFYQHGPNPIRDSKTAHKIAGILEEHGWLVPIEGSAMINGQRRRKAWRVVR